MGTAILVLTVFCASAVEAVEALTIVLAAGFARDWRSALLGVGAALVVLAALVAALGPLLRLLPLDVVRIAVGGMLLVFGLQWLRKAILRASGLKPRHDEDAAYQESLEAARGFTTRSGRRTLDSSGFGLSFKGSLLEGLEVVFIVLTFGANQHGRYGWAALGAAIAVVTVAALGLAVRAPLSRVPENAMKFAVGVMLTSFGTFWGAEGAGGHWPGGDASLLWLVPAVLALSCLLAAVLRTHSKGSLPRPAHSAVEG